MVKRSAFIFTVLLVCLLFVVGCGAEKVDDAKSEDVVS